MGPPAIADVVAVELPFAGDVLLPPGRLQSVLTLSVPAGRVLVSATAAIVNRGTNNHEVDLWLTAVPSAVSIAGPRAVQLTLGPGMATSVSLGPTLALVGANVTATLIAQRDADNADDQIWITEGTELVNRAGATAMVALIGVGAIMS
jgi:hypothetical protein